MSWSARCRASRHDGTTVIYGCCAALSIHRTDLCRVIQPLPKKCGEAVYVKEAFNFQPLAIFVGILVILNGSVSAAALANGFVGYWQTFMAMPDWMVIVLITAALGILAAWGIGQSVMMAAVITLIEVGAC